MDPYEVLGVDQEATREEIKRAYKKLSQKYHPDKDGGDAQKMVDINVAYEILCDPERRKAYDEFGDISSDLNPRKEAKQIIRACFIAVVEHADNLDDLNMVESLRRNIEKVIDEEYSSIMTSKVEIDKYNKAKSKLLSGNQFLVDELDRRINQYQLSIKSCEYKIKVLRIGLELLYDVDWEFEDDDRPTITFKRLANNPMW